MGMPFVLALLLQVAGPVAPGAPPDLPLGAPNPDADVIVGGEIDGPFIYWEDAGQTTKVILKNGLTVLLHESNAAGLTSITGHVRAGHFDEPDALAGVTRVISGLVLDGGPDGAGARIRTLGGAVSASIGGEHTLYQTIVPSEHAVAALEILADGLWNRDLDPERAAWEVEAALRERGGMLANVDAVARDGLYRTAFVAHRVRRPPIGGADSLRSWEPDDIDGFRNRYYQPSNVILTLVGRFNRIAMLDEVLRIHGDVPNTPVDAEPAPNEPPQLGLRYDWMRGAVREPTIAVGYHVPGVEAAGPDPYALETLSAILTGGRASRMNWFLRDEQALIAHAESSYLAFGGMGYFQILLRAPDPDAALIAVFGELDRIRRFGVTGEDLARAQARVARDYYRRIETVGGLGVELSLEEARGDWKRARFHLDGIADVTADDIARIVERHFTRENVSVFEYLPSSSTRALSTGEFESSVLDRVPVNVVERSIEAVGVSAEIERAGDALVVDVIPTLQRRSILRGPDVYIAEDHRLPLVSFGIFFPGGRLSESASNAGVTELMLHSALRGSLRYNTADIARRIENAGVDIEIVNEPDLYGYVLDGSSSGMDDAIGILMDVLQAPTFLEQDVEREKALQAARIRSLSEDGVGHSLRLFLATVFDDHAYARPAAGTETSIGGLDADDVVEWQQQHQRRVMPVIVIAGDTRGTELIAPIAEGLTNEDLVARDLSTLPFPGAPLDEEEAAFAVDGRQSVVVYGTMVAPYAHEDRLGLTVVRHVLSGRGGRLDAALRDAGVPAHPVDLDADFHARAGAFYAYAAFSPGDEPAVRGAIRAEIDRLIEDGVTVDEVEAAVDRATLRHRMTQETRRGRLMALARAVVAGADVASVELHGEQLRQVDRDVVRFVAERYLAAGQSKTVVARGER